MIPISEDIVAEYADFVNKPIPMMRDYTSKGCAMAAAVWNSMDGTWAQRAARFYDQFDKLYIYDHLVAHVNYEFTRKWIEKYLRPELEASGKALKIADVGGGIGIHRLWMASQGHYVDHIDMPGRQSEFADWRSRQYRKEYGITGNGVEAFGSWNFISLDTWKDNSFTGYDVIFSYATLEHFGVDEISYAMRGWKQRTRVGVQAKQIHWIDPHCGDSHPMHRGNGRQEAIGAMWNWKYHQPAEHIAPQVWVRRD